MSGVFRVIDGRGDVVAFIERLLAKAKAGEIDGIVAGWIEPEQAQRPAMSAMGYAYYTELPHAWPRLVTAALDAGHTLLRDGLAS